MLATRRQTILTLGAALLGGAAVPALAGGPPSRRETPIFLGLVSGAAQAQLEGLQVKLHNYKANSGRGGHDVNASSITFPGRAPQMFDIPTFKRGHMSYYINDVNLDGARVRELSGRGLKLTLTFESDGKEIKGHCRGTIFQCPFGPDSTAPDIQIHDMKLEVVLVPMPHLGSLTFVPADVAFSGEIRAGGICGGPDLCNMLTHYRAEIRRAVQSEFGKRLGADDTKSQFARALRPVLDLLRIGEVERAVVRGGNIIVTHTSRA